MNETTKPACDAVYTSRPICASRQVALYHRDFRHNRIYRCEDCRVQFMNPVYSDDYPPRYCADYYHGDAPGDEISLGQERANRIKFRFMNGNKAHAGDSPVAQFFSHAPPSRLYSSAGFFVIARKTREA